MYGATLPVFCRVGVPDHAQWCVELANQGDRWGLGRGWRLFTHFACFQQGDLLTFTYEGDDLFMVRRFNYSLDFPFLDHEVFGDQYEREEAPNTDQSPVANAAVKPDDSADSIQTLGDNKETESIGRALDLELNLPGLPL
ncbi:hypothetical protein SASPL_133492 [Salvia splendens]|uniref:TF-B3 domain-containing protein n=1 Tax=Salvia splendens TaxID=180675 RepID=A0A8X8ZIG8_SALSN|nr:hypothetical protein SASPL_133492 [Salvia splendens]